MALQRSYVRKGEGLSASEARNQLLHGISKKAEEHCMIGGAVHVKYTPSLPILSELSTSHFPNNYTFHQLL